MSENGNGENQYNFEYNKYTTITPSHISEPTDHLANAGGRGLVISFHHVPSGKFVFFKAFITAFTETYAPDWAAETVYGRADPIYLFKNTTRKISLSFKIPAISEGEAFENLSRVQQLVQFLYPTYVDVNNANTISQSPLVRLKVMNLARDTSTSTTITYQDEMHHAPEVETAEELESLTAQLEERTTSMESTDSYNDYRSDTDSSRGLLGVINNLSIDHNLANSEAGVIEKGVNTILPKLIEVNLDFSPIHEHPVGWKEGTTFEEDKGEIPSGELVFASPGFPYMGDNLNVTVGTAGGLDPGGLAGGASIDADAAEFATAEEEAAAIAAEEGATSDTAGEDSFYALLGGDVEETAEGAAIELHEEYGGEAHEGGVHGEP